MDSGDDSEYEPMSTDMLEDISEGIKSHLIVNRRYTWYKILDSINWGKMEWKGALLSTQKHG